MQEVISMRSKGGYCSKIIRDVVFLIMLASLTGLPGYINVANAAAGDVDYVNSCGEHRIVRINHDLYIEKLDGSERRQLTNTPDIEEGGAFFTKDGKYIVYFEGEPTADSRIDSQDRQNYIIKSDGNDSMRRKISFNEAYNHWLGRCIE
jgi:hypothetical protein